MLTAAVWLMLSSMLYALQLNNVGSVQAKLKSP